MRNKRTDVVAADKSGYECWSEFTPAVFKPLIYVDLFKIACDTKEDGNVLFRHL